MPQRYARISSERSSTSIPKTPTRATIRSSFTTTSSSVSPAEQAFANDHLRETKHEEADPPSSLFPLFRGPISVTPSFSLSLVLVIHTVSLLCRQPHGHRTLIRLGTRLHW